MTLEWVHVVIALAGVVFGAISGLIAGVWRVARIDQEVRNDLNKRVADAVHEMNQKVELITDQFDETLKGLRQKINDVELATHKYFVSKPEFEDFRKEYREDMRELKQGISEVRNMPRSSG